VVRHPKYVAGFKLDRADIDLDQPNRVMQEQLRSAGIRVVDALPALRHAFAEGVRPYGYVDRHFSPDGHAIVADLIQDTVAVLLRARKPGAAPGSARVRPNDSGG
jgi:hypothetical protein